MRILLSCLMLGLIPFYAAAQAQLPDCPPREIYKHSCVGTEDRYDEKFVGEFLYYRRNGQGTSLYRNGDKYVGQFKDGQRNGQGTFDYSSGDKYVGEWKEDKPNGNGTYSFANGNKHNGEFKDGQPNGFGSYTFSNGNQHTGEWKLGKPHGLGIEYTASGAISRQGQWESGSLIQSLVLDSRDFPRTPPILISTSLEQVNPPKKAELDRTSLSLESAQTKCRELGFKPKTEGFGKCVLQLSK